MTGFVCVAEGCDRATAGKSKSGLCPSCAGRKAMAKRAHQLRELRLQTVSDGSKSASPEAAAKTASELDAIGQACFDRCIRGGIQPKKAMQLARDEMRIYARAAARGVRPAPITLPVSTAVHVRNVVRRTGHLLPEFTASGAQNER